MTALYGQFAQSAPTLEAALAAYRYQVFVERLKWDVPTDGTSERDQFDRLDTVYVLTRGTDGQINGCARLLPTTRPYLLAEVFPELLNGMPVPCSDDVWELSRFAAMDLNAPLTNGQGQMSSPVAVDLLRASIECAAQYGARRLITTSPLGVERLLRRAGFNAHRAGPPKMVHGYPLYACWIEVQNNLNHSIQSAQAAKHVAH
jgi:acyl homoserine lactone synthase